MSGPSGFGGINPALAQQWLETSLHPAREEAPSDYLTRAQLEVLWRVSQSTATERIRRLQREGRIVLGWRRRAGGWSPAYKLLPKGTR
jgi:hypothetical protein